MDRFLLQENVHLVFRRTDLNLYDYWMNMLDQYFHSRIHHRTLNRRLQMVFWNVHLPVDVDELYSDPLGL